MQNQCYIILMITTTELIDTAMELPVSDRSYIANKLIESIEEGNELSTEWMSEIQQRVARREAGESKAVSRENVHADIEKILG